MKLIIEDVTDYGTLSEVVEGKKAWFIEGVFLQSEVKNRNGRLYPKGVMESAVDAYVPKVTRGTAYGELGHPDGPKINEERISHITQKLEWHGNNVNGRARLIEKGLGAIAIAMLEAGGTLGVSSRGLGSLKRNNGLMEVQGDFMLATVADIVTDPSAPDAFVNGIMENVDWVHDAGGKWTRQFVEEAQRTIHTTSKANLEEAKIKVFESFMARLRG